MAAIKQKYVRTSLNDGQINLLGLIYTYRFASRQLLAHSLGVQPQNGLYEKLEILVTHGYLGKRQEKRLKLENVPAAYYLAPKGLTYLQSLPAYAHIDQQSFRESYRDKSTTGFPFIRHSFNIYQQTLHLQAQYPGLKVFTPRDMRRYRYFPARLPDAFLSLPSDDAEQPHRFFFDIVRDRQPRSDLINKLKAYTEFFENGGWDETGSEIPVLLLLCEWSPAEKSIQRLTRRQLSDLDSDLRVFTSTFAAASNPPANASIWSDIYDADESARLDAISIDP